MAGVGPALLLAFALTCSISPLWFGFYDLSQWGVLALVLLGVLLAAAIARPALPTGPLALALAGLVGLAAWSFASTAWAESTARAVVDGDRWILYTAMLAALVLLLRERRNALVLLAGTTAGVLAIAAYELVRMLDGHGVGLFLGGRLNEPLGYVNGQAGLLILGIWPLVALAERRQVVQSALAVTAATLLTCMVVLTQARGTVLAGLVSIPIVLALVPGRTARLWVLVTIAAAVAAGSGPLLHVYRTAPGGLTSDVVRRAGLTAVVASLLAGIAWGVANVGLTALARGSRDGERVAVRTVRGFTIALGVAAVVALAAGGSRIVHEARTQYHSFVTLDSSYGGSRFLSGAGSRYDFWRIALRELSASPVHGVGAGNYDRRYFVLRRTPEDVRQPHSLELQTLSELGVVGGGVLALFLGGLFWALAAVARRGRADRLERTLAVAAGGTAVAWLTHTSVDWLHLLPGVTGVALACAAVLLAPWLRERRPDPGRRLWTYGIPAAVTLLAAAAAVAVARPVLAEHKRSVASAEAVRDPVAAIRDANTSIGLLDDVDTYYVKAAAYARLDDFADASGTLLQAERLEPHNFVTWGLLGDLAARHGEVAKALGYYRRASALDPLDADLQNLARNRTAVAAIAAGP